MNKSGLLQQGMIVKKKLEEQKVEKKAPVQEKPREKRKALIKIQKFGLPPQRI